MHRNVAAGLLAVIVTVGSGGAISAQTPGTTKSSVIQKIIVKVNGEIYTQSELERDQIAEIRQRDNRRLTPQDLTNDAKLQAILGEITPTLLVEAIDGLLMVQRGRELGAKFTEATFKNGLESLKKSNNLDDAGLQKAMAQEGITLEELRHQFERQFLVQHVQREEIPISLTEEEARQYYKAHPEEFMKPATVTVRELLVAAADTTEAAQQAALAKLKEAIDRASKGEDFAAIVKSTSDSASKASGGLIESVTVDVIAPAYRTEIEKIQVGAITAPIKTDTGYVVFKLESKTNAEPLPLEQVMDQITQKLGEEKMDTAVKKHIEKLRAQAIIEWKDDGYRQMYETHLKAKKTQE
jgi:peptidyl-prolyl cis-trans isomerase SurA